MTAYSLPLLAPELIEAVSNELSFKEVKSLRLVSREIANALEKRILRSIILRVHPEDAHDHVARLKTLFEALQTGHNASSVTRRLVLDVETCHWKQDEDAQQLLHLEDELRLYLPWIIRSLKNVIDLRWNYHEAGSDWTTPMIIEALRPFIAGLRVVDMPRLQEGNIPLLNGLLKLRSLKVNIGSGDWSSPSILRAIERSSTTLQSLSLTGSGVEIGHVLKLSSPAVRGLPSLANLALDWGPKYLTIPPTNVTTSFPIFPSLASFVLKLSDFDEDNDLQAAKDFWTLFLRSNVHLKSITVNFPCPIPRTLVDYLSSYSDGLMALDIRWRERKDKPNPLVDILLSETLLCHQQSLRSMTISSTQTQHLVFLENAYPRLKDLAFEGITFRHQSDLHEFLSTLLDSIMETNPQVQRITVAPPPSEEQHNRENLCEALRAYRCDANRASVPPQLVLLGLSWKAVENQEQWQYVEVE